MSEREYSPKFLSDQMGGFIYALESSPTGREVLEIINQENARGMHKLGGGPYMDGIKFSFPEELKADFERLTQSPYVECLKDAVYIVELDLKPVMHSFFRALALARSLFSMSSDSGILHLDNQRGSGQDAASGSASTNSGDRLRTFR